MAQCIAKQLKLKNIQTETVSVADEAIKVADNNRPDAVITELSLRGHSGSEFLYEFRTYADWQDIHVIIYSSIKPTEELMNSKDWKLLNIADFLYKPTVSLRQLADVVETSINR